MSNSASNKASGNIDQLREVVYAQGPQFSAVVSNAGLVFDREAAFAMQLFMANSYLAGVAMNNKNSVISAISNIAAIGISLNPASKLAYLVPRDGKVCLDISYMGLMHIAQQTGAIKWGQAVAVRQNDTFELSDINAAPTHKYNPFSLDRGEIVGCYVVVKTGDGDYLTHTMSIDSVYSIRDRMSESWKAYMRDKTKKTPWLTDEEEMVKKTVVKQAWKYWPRRERLDAAVNHLNTDGGEGFDLNQAPTTPAQIAAAAKPVIEHSDERTALIESLENSAKTGLSAYELAFVTLTKDQRKSVGNNEHERLKALASSRSLPMTKPQDQDFAKFAQRDYPPDRDLDIEGVC